MPVYELACEAPSCESKGNRFESLLRHWDDPNPPCPHCGGELKRLPAAPKAIWMKNWAEYGYRGEQDRKNPNWTPEGVWAYRTKTSRNADGSKEKVLLTTHAEMRSFCRDEGLIPPDDVNPNIEVGKDGKATASGGVAGQWI